MLDNYRDIFTGVGLVDGEYHTKLRDDAKPTIHPPRKVPLSLIPKVNETLEKLMIMGVVSKVDKATEWVNSLVIVEKKGWLTETLSRSKRSQQFNQERVVQAANSRKNIQQTEGKVTVHCDRHELLLLPQKGRQRIVSSVHI